MLSRMRVITYVEKFSVGITLAEFCSNVYVFCLGRLSLDVKSQVPKGVTTNGTGVTGTQECAGCGKHINERSVIIQWTVMFKKKDKSSNILQKYFNSF